MAPAGGLKRQGQLRTQSERTQATPARSLRFSSRAASSAKRATRSTETSKNTELTLWTNYPRWERDCLAAGASHCVLIVQLHESGRTAEVKSTGRHALL